VTSGAIIDMSQELIKAIYDIRDESDSLQKKVDAISQIHGMTEGETEMAFRLGNSLHGWRGFHLGALAQAAGITNFLVNK